MTIRVLDPTHESDAPRTGRAVRPRSLAGKRVAFVSNGKEGTKGFFAHMDRGLRAQLGVGEVVWLTKSNYSAPADPWITAELGRFDAVVTGIGD
jgi:hypothetical protein